MWYQEEKMNWFSHQLNQRESFKPSQDDQTQWLESSSHIMKRLSGQARYRLLIGFLVFILFYYAYRSFSDYSNKIIHEVCYLFSLPRHVIDKHSLFSGSAWVFQNKRFASARFCVLWSTLPWFEGLHHQTALASFQESPKSHWYWVLPLR